MLIVYRRGNGDDIIYPIGSFELIKKTVEINRAPTISSYDIVGVLISNAHARNYGYTDIVLGKYKTKEDRDAAFERFIMCPGVYESFGREDERIFRPISETKSRDKG